MSQPEWTADWDDVLRRAGHARSRTRRAAAIAAVGAVALVLALPGIGIGGGIDALFANSARPGVPFTAKLSRSALLVGTLSVRASRLFVSVDPKTGRITSLRPNEGTFGWSVDLTGAAAVSSLRIVDRRTGQVAVRLCSPCQNREHGTFRRSRLTFSAVFAHGIVVAETSRGQVRAALRLGTAR